MRWQPDLFLRMLPYADRHFHRPSFPAGSNASASSVSSDSKPADPLPTNRTLAHPLLSLHRTLTRLHPRLDRRCPPSSLSLRTPCRPTLRRETSTVEVRRGEALCATRTRIPRTADWRRGKASGAGSRGGRSRGGWRSTELFSRPVSPRMFPHHVVSSASYPFHVVPSLSWLLSSVAGT